jgi:DNA-binding CsgD family transcriptional regulator
MRPAGSTHLLPQATLPRLVMSTDTEPDNDLAELIAMAYESNCSAQGIQNFAERTAAYFDAPQIAISLWPVQPPDAILPITFGISPDTINATFSTRHEPGTLFARLDDMEVGDYFIADHSGNAAGTFHTMAGILHADESNRCLISLFREPTDQPFTKQDCTKLETLGKYFSRATDLNRKFIKLSFEHHTAYRILDDTPRGIVIFGRNSRVTYVNIEAKQLLDQKDGVYLQDDKLIIDEKSARDEITDFFTQVDQITENTTSRLMRTIPRESSRSQFQLLIYSLPFGKRRAALTNDESIAVAVLYDPLLVRDIKINVLQTFFALSIAESHLARHLYSGKSLADASAALNISVHTARSQLKNIFRKVGVKSQPALLKTLTQSLKDF